MEDQSSSSRRGRGHKVVTGVLIVLVIAAAGASGVLFMKYRGAVAKSGANEQADIVATVDKAVLLPDEQPGISTVIDKSKLSNPTLKARAENGDKLLIFVKAGRLIIYRPSTGKVVDMLTIASDAPDNSGATAKDAAR